MNSGLRSQAQRILDAKPRRTLAARLEGDAIVTTAGSDEDSLEDGTDDPTSAIETQVVRILRSVENDLPETSSSSKVSRRRRPFALQAARIRSRCSSGETNDSPPRAPTCKTRMIPTARRLEVALPLREGDRAPDFTLIADTGEPVTLSSLQGSPIVLYFYPKDDTPGCTTQAREFRDEYSRFRQRGVVVLGVSPDDEASHVRFKEKYSLPFTLLADPDHRTDQDYGVWVEKTMYGKKRMGIKRSTFVIDGEGKVARAMYGVKPEGHADEVLEALPG